MLVVDSSFSHGSQTLAYSCSVDGLVIVWDVSTLKMRRQFHLSCHKLTAMQLDNSTLWCCEYPEVFKHVGDTERPMPLRGTTKSCFVWYKTVAYHLTV